MPDTLPLVEELRPAPPAEEVFLRLCGLPHCLFLDSALKHPRLGRFSFVAVDPFDFLEPSPATDGIAALARRLTDFTAAQVAGLPPFQGGAAGLFGYDLGRQIEPTPGPAFNEFQMPVMAIGLYDLVVAFDHSEDRAWIISQGFPEINPADRRRRAADRLRQMRRWLAGPPPTPSAAPLRRRATDLAADELAPQFAVESTPGLTSNFSAKAYLQAVQSAIDYIAAGDIFQVNLSQRLLHRALSDPVSLYLRLRLCNRATFAGYFDLGEFQIVSASPERFLRVDAGRVETRPIKGTRLRSQIPLADAFSAAELQENEKDRAENVMIVDLLRNDLSRVCEPDSVRVTQLCELESYAFVQHLVSAVEGRLRPEASPLDLLRASFPGGSITGAPKVRAMQIIAELEPTARGAYCGSLGYIGFDGSMDTNILIRTITAGRGWWQAPVGGGIVAQSDPRREYEETWHKAEGLLRALR